MKKLVSCGFNMDSACVEPVYSDNSIRLYRRGE